MLQSFSTWALPYLPAHDEVVLTTLPDAAERKQLRALQRQPQAEVSSLDSILSLATRYVALGRAQADERYFSNAASLLESWLTRNDVPHSQWSSLQLLHADVLQHQHQFAAAEKVLNIVLERDRAQPRAHLMLAALQMANGRPQQAATHCRALALTQDLTTSLICLQAAHSLTGQLPEALRALALVEQQRMDAPLQAWLNALLGDMHERAGHEREAEQRWRRALVADATDLPTRLSLADLLLRQQRGTEVMSLLRTAPPADGVLLRRALAEQQLGGHAEQQAWRERVRRNQQLGITLHLREQALGELLLDHQPEQALRSALVNWQTQREPLDARVLARAALAARDNRTLLALDRWRSELHLQDVQLDALLRERS